MPLSDRWPQRHSNLSASDGIEVSSGEPDDFDILGKMTPVPWLTEMSSEILRARSSANFARRNPSTSVEALLQAEGGMGFTWEMGLHFHMRRMIAAR